MMSKAAAVMYLSSGASELRFARCLALDPASCLPLRICFLVFSAVVVFCELKF